MHVFGMSHEASWSLPRCGCVVQSCAIECPAHQNLLAGNPDQIEFVMHAKIIPQLVSHPRNEKFSIQQEACWALRNAAAGGNDAQIRTLAEQGALTGLCALFKCPDSNVIMVAMEGVECILRIGKADAALAHDGRNVYADIVGHGDANGAVAA
jgi:importin subunit alpha-1